MRLLLKGRKNKKTIITILLAVVAMTGQGYHVRSEKIASLSLSSLRLSPSAPDLLFPFGQRPFFLDFAEGFSLNMATFSARLRLIYGILRIFAP